MIAQVCYIRTRTKSEILLIRYMHSCSLNSFINVMGRHKIEVLISNALFMRL